MISILGIHLCYICTVAALNHDGILNAPQFSPHQNHNTFTIFFIIDTMTSHRTRTGTQTIFNLSHPYPVVYNFTDLSTDGLKITVPPYSPWICRVHWHETALACETLAPIEGHFIIYDNFVFTPGSGTVTGNGQNPPTFVMPLNIDLQVQWERNPNADPGETVVFSLKAADKANEFYGFYRQLCSVNQDAEMYC
jgi:hypothetical protein